MSKLGKYLIFLSKLFTNPEKFRVYWALTMQECKDIGINSMLIVTIVSSFLGAV
jgi:phospholipid/cholesterol/gamma-HCH transport system permease protein